MDNCLVRGEGDGALESEIKNATIPHRILNRFCKKSLDFIKFREATAVIFFNDELDGEVFDGGNLYFSKYGVRGMMRSLEPASMWEDFPDYMKVTPKCGRIAIFRSDVSNPHAVGEIFKGDRWVLQLFMVPGLPFSLPDTRLETAYFEANLRLYYGRLVMHFHLSSMGSILPWAQLSAFTLPLCFVYLFTSLRSALCKRSPALERIIAKSSLRILTFFACLYYALYVNMNWKYFLNFEFLYAFLLAISLIITLLTASIPEIPGLLFRRIVVGWVCFTFHLACWYGYDPNSAWALHDETLKYDYATGHGMLPAHPGLRTLPTLDEDYFGIY